VALGAAHEHASATCEPHHRPPIHNTTTNEIIDILMETSQRNRYPFTTTRSQSKNDHPPWFLGTNSDQARTSFLSRTPITQDSQIRLLQLFLASRGQGTAPGENGQNNQDRYPTNSSR